MSNKTPVEKALAVLVLTTATRQWLETHDPKALAQADAAIAQFMPDELGRARANAAEAPPASDALHALQDRLRARAEYIKALAELSQAAKNLQETWERQPAGIYGTLGGHPDYIDTYEGFAFEMAEWLREQSAQWLHDPLDEEEK